LFLALFNHHSDVAEALVNWRRTDLNLLTQGYRPVHWARALGYEDLARTITDRLASR
jgi:hypothetical protein